MVALEIFVWPLEKSKCNMKQIWQEIKERWPLAVLGALAGLLTAILW